MIFRFNLAIGSLKGVQGPSSRVIDLCKPSTPPGLKWISAGLHIRPSSVPSPYLIEVEKVESENYHERDFSYFIDQNGTLPRMWKYKFLTCSNDTVDVSSHGDGLIRRPDDHHSECLLGVSYFFGIPSFNGTYC